LTALPEEDLLGLRFLELFAEKDRQRIKELLEGTDDEPRGLSEDNPASVNEYQVTLDVLPIPGGDGKAVVILNNVSERKKAEKALKKSEERYRVLFENANDAIFIVQGGVVKFPNRKTVEIVGYSEEELAKVPFADFIHPEDRDMVLERHKSRLEGEHLPSTYSFRVLNRSGEEFWVELTAVLIDWEGRPATLNFLRDITEKKRLETRIQQAQRMEAIGTLAGGLAHDFNNLLMAIQGNASLMLLKKDPGDPDYARLKNIEQYVRNGAEHTKQLLGFARGGKYEVKAADLNEIVEKSSAMFGQTRKEITIHKKYEMEIWAVEVDRAQIQQVLMNFYINAWQAMPGGGDLFIETENAKLGRSFVRPHGIKPGKYVKLSLTDTGVGMDKNTQQRIFDPFFTTKEMGRGSGLGLALAYAIIKNHGGIIDVSSKKGEGSTFIIYLPVSEKDVPREKELPEEILEGTETILLVDDEEMIIDAGREMLEEMGYTVLTAISGQDAIEAYRERKDEIHMVILDMIMPEMGGGETYHKLRELNPEIKVLLSSGYSVDGQATEILERGCNGFIQKPFNMKEISHKIKGILDKE
jgi:PAS domain S-box-containing protein